MVWMCEGVYRGERGGCTGCTLLAWALGLAHSLGEGTDAGVVGARPTRSARAPTRGAGGLAMVAAAGCSAGLFAVVLLQDRHPQRMDLVPATQSLVGHEAAAGRHRRRREAALVGVAFHVVGLDRVEALFCAAFRTIYVKRAVDAGGGGVARGPRPRRRGPTRRGRTRPGRQRPATSRPRPARTNEATGHSGGTPREPPGARGQSPARERGGEGGEGETGEG